MSEASVEFGDWEPEDSWDASDATDEQMRNLELRLDLLDIRAKERGFSDVFKATDEDRLDRIEQRVEHYRRFRERLSERDDLRLRQLVEDVEFVRGRIGG